MKISKYNASGNDFVIFHTFKKEDFSQLSRLICDRHGGVGADGLVILLPSQEADFEWLFYNCDGSEAFMCGNASRAVAHYAFTNKLASSELSFMTKAGLIKASVLKDEVKTQLSEHKKLAEKFSEEGKEWHFYDTGVPHLVCLQENIDEFDENLMRKMRQKYDANVNIACVKNLLHVRTYERGVEGETLACGTGMCASFLAAFEAKLINSSCEVRPKSQEILKVSLHENRLFFQGKVSHVFDCVFKNP